MKNKEAGLEIKKCVSFENSLFYKSKLQFSVTLIFRKTTVNFQLLQEFTPHSALLANELDMHIEGLVSEEEGPLNASPLHTHHLGKGYGLLVPHTKEKRH